MLHSRPCALLYSSVLVLLNVASSGIRFSYNHSARTQRKTQPVLLTTLVYRAVRKRRPTTVTRLSGRCLSGRCLAMGSLFLRARVLRECVYQAVA
jgi:hypothetical protein